MEIDSVSRQTFPAPSPLGPKQPAFSRAEGNLFDKILAEVHQKQREADTQVSRFLLGEGELHEAVLALEHADLTFRLLVQVRNKLIQAYEELSRMSL